MKHTTSELILKSGARGLLVHVPDASVMTFDINFRAGEYLVDPLKWEVPHLMEHLLLGANELIPHARDFQAEIEKNGAYSNASTGVYDITYEAECADFEWQRVLELLMVSITKPLFLEEEFKAEYGNVEEELAGRANNHFRRLSLEMRAKLGLLAKTDAERLELMKNVTVDDVRAHYGRTHTAPNMRFVIAGNLTPTRKLQIQELLEQAILPETGTRFELPDELPHRLDAPVFVANKTVENLYFYIDTFMNRRLNDPETDALNIANVMLTETLYSKILGTAREQGLVYGMSSGLSHVRDSSNWWFGAQVSEKNAPALMEVTVRELINVLDGRLAAPDIDAAKQYSLGRYQRSGQTVHSTASGYAGRYFFDDVVEDYYGVPERIKAVTQDVIVQAARAMFADNIWGIGFLGSSDQAAAEKLAAQIAPLWQTKG